MIPEDVLDDLCSRFLINIPEEEKGNLVRICFQIELAHWFYIDFHREKRPQLPGCSMREFTYIIFGHLPFLRHRQKDVDDLLAQWKSYKRTVPVFGAIILNETVEFCVLVQGYWSKTSWSFPKGKVNLEEPEFDCAVREVEEETGLNVRQYANAHHYLEQKINEQQVRLYIVPGVPKSTAFKPQTRKEIREIKWFALKHLPTHKGDTISQKTLGLSWNNFFQVIPFLKPLKKWIASHSKPGTSVAHHPPLSTVDTIECQQSNVAVPSSTLRSMTQSDAVAHHNTYHLQPSLIHRPVISHQLHYRPGILPLPDAFRFSNYGSYSVPVRPLAVGQVATVGQAVRGCFPNNHTTSLAMPVLVGSAKQEQVNDVECLIPRYLPWDNFSFDRKSILSSMSLMT